MVLQHERLPETVFLIRLRSDVDSGALELNVIVNEHTIVHDDHVTWCHHLPIVGKAGSAEENVVALPLAWLAARVHQRDVLLVNARRLTVRISSIDIGIQDLNFVPALKKYTAVATLLPSYSVTMSLPTIRWWPRKQYSLQTSENSPLVVGFRLTT